MNALNCIGYLSDTSLLLEHVDPCGHIATRQPLHCGLQLWVFLTHDLIKLRRAHPGLDQLLEGLTGLDALMLACVADQQDSILRADLSEKFAHLACAGEAGFVHHI